MPSKKRTFTQVPFDGDGNMRTWTPANPGEDSIRKHYDGRPEDHWTRNNSTLWRPADDFDAVMTLKGAHRGRSAAHLLLNDQDGHEYTMFLTDFVHAAKQGVHVGGKIAGRFEFVKRGQNYGIRLLESKTMDVKPLDEDGIAKPFEIDWQCGGFGLDETPFSMPEMDEVLGPNG